MENPLTRPDPAPAPVRFPSGGLHCVGDLFLPRPREEHGPPAPPWPVVVMAHGIGAEREWGLTAFAERFASAGIAALVFDYRHLGDSPGEPRRLVSPARQRADYRAALAFVRGDPRLNEDRVGLWGTSFSGGHVLALAAGRPEGVRAVVSQIPFVSGIASTLAFPFRYQLPAALLGALDAAGAVVGAPPRTVPVVRERGLALLASPDSHAGYLALLPDRAPPPAPVPARVFLEVLRYHPGRHAHRIEAPVLIVGASNDSICPIEATRRVASRTPGARLVEVPGGHFDVYRGETFEAVVELETAFLVEHLLA
jgi:pimeloyl-ACP methyl ester carboxylesterase